MSRRNPTRYLSIKLLVFDFLVAHTAVLAVKHKTRVEDPLTRMLYCYLYSIIFLIKRNKKLNPISGIPIRVQLQYGI